MKKRIHRHFKKHKQAYKHLPVALILYMAFSLSLFLGLKINPAYGDIGIILTAIFSVIYIFTHTRKVRRPPNHNLLRKIKKVH